MVQVYLVAVLLGLELAGHPLASINPELRTPQRLAILLPANALVVGVLALHPVIRAIVGNLKDLIEQRIGLEFARTCVLFRECGLFCQPLANCRSRRHPLISANCPKAFPVSNALAYGVSLFLGEC